MNLLQVIPKEVPATREGLLWAFISVLIIGFGWLALWVRKMHNEAIKTHKEFLERSETHKNQVIEVVKTNSQAFFEMKGAIEMNTIVTKNAAEAGERSAQRLDDTMRNLNENILKSGNQRK